MGEGSIIELMLARGFGLGLQFVFPKGGDKSVFIVIPFVMVYVTFKKKTSQNDWFSFVNLM